MGGQRRCQLPLPAADHDVRIFCNWRVADFWRATFRAIVEMDAQRTLQRFEDVVRSPRLFAADQISTARERAKAGNGSA